jgi:ferredoxin
LPKNKTKSDKESGFLPRANLQSLLDLLLAEGYATIGPVAKDGAIQYRPVSQVSELPRGVEVEQAPGSYRLSQEEGERLFDWANGPQALKPFLFAPREPLWRATRGEDGGLKFEPVLPDPEPTAVIGLRACDLAALALQDKHFLGGAASDPHYQARREGLLAIGVDCSHPAATCFCASTGDGPSLSSGFDIGLSELDDGFLLRSGTPRGKRLLAKLDLKPASKVQLNRQAKAEQVAIKAQKKGLPSRNLQGALFSRLATEHWEAVAKRCLACGNCTAVCPSCFCYSVHAEPSLDGAVSEQVRQWDSCFSEGHSAMHRHPVRPDILTRYRQWVTHKLGGWHAQYGRSGCVGCGRCISWCPAAIDIRDEVERVMVEACHE